MGKWPMGLAGRTWELSCCVAPAGGSPAWGYAHVAAVEPRPRPNGAHVDVRLPASRPPEPQRVAGEITRGSPSRGDLRDPYDYSRSSPGACHDTSKGGPAIT